MAPSSTGIRGGRRPAGCPVDTLIVGAGPAGLAAARALQARGREFLIVDGGQTIADSWRRHYDRLHLHTVRGESHLPDRPMPDHWPRYVSRDQVVEYLEAYTRHFGLEPMLGCRVTCIEPGEAGWRATLATGDTLDARHVIVATGTNRVPVEPDWPGRAETALQVTHSRAYKNADPFAGARVLVVGMGNTGAEIALDLSEHGVAATISVRGTVNVIRRDVLGLPVQLTALRLQRLPTALAAPIGRLLQSITVGSLRRWGLERPPHSPLMQLRTTGKTPVIDIGTIEAIKRGRISVRPAIRRFHGREVEFVDGRIDPFDHVILATGYRPDLESLVPAAAGMLDQRGFPHAIRGTGTLSGLYFLGFNPYDAGGVLRTIRHDAVRIADYLDASDGKAGAG